MSDFPDKELIEFYHNLKLEFDLSDDSTICRRWKANFAYFRGDLKKASNEYDKLFDYAVNLNDFPEWYLDDICIDGRNIFQQYENTINKFSKNMTTIIIAHRLSTIKDCDKIFVFKDGQIVETGNHRDLLKQRGYYYQLWNGQDKSIT